MSETQTTAGALNTIVNNLQSIRTLAVESANGSNSASDRAALNNQVQQQIAEITQIAQQTSFNGLNVLNGSSGVTTYQVGANVGNTISVNLTQGVAPTRSAQVASNTTDGAATAATDGSCSWQLDISSGRHGRCQFAVATDRQYLGSALRTRTRPLHMRRPRPSTAPALQGLTATATSNQLATIDAHRLEHGHHRQRFIMRCRSMA